MHCKNLYHQLVLLLYRHDVCKRSWWRSNERTTLKMYSFSTVDVGEKLERQIDDIFPFWNCIAIFVSIQIFLLVIIEKTDKNISIVT